MAMPRILRVSLVYGLIGVAIYGNLFPKTIVKEVVKEEEYTITLKPEKKEEQVSVAEEKTRNCRIKPRNVPFRRNWVQNI